MGGNHKDITERGGGGVRLILSWHNQNPPKLPLLSKANDQSLNWNHFFIILHLVYKPLVIDQSNAYSFLSYIVLVAIGDEGSLHVSPAINALKRLGASDPDVTVKLRESYALIGYAGDNKPSWIEQKSATKANGPSIISSRILLKLCKLRHFTPQTLLDIK